LLQNFDDKGVKNRGVRLDFRWQRIPRLQNTVGPRRLFALTLLTAKIFWETTTVHLNTEMIAKQSFGVLWWWY